MSPLLSHLGLFERLGTLFLREARLLHPLARFDEDYMVAEFSGYRWPSFTVHRPIVTALSPSRANLATVLLRGVAHRRQYLGGL
jgi:hypothetical protein